MNHSLRQPDFFVVGAPKAGTTALCHYLSEHEMIFLSDPKELYFWARDLPGQVRHGGCGTLDSYLAKFEDAGPLHRICGEGSTHYLTSEVAIRDIMSFNSAAKIIAMLRNPIELVHAYHGELVFNFMETELDFETAWHSMDRRVAAGDLPGRCPSTHNIDYKRFALFEPQLRRLWDLVPEDQRLLLVFDDLKSDARNLYQTTLEFLGVPDDNRQHFEVVYASREHRFEGFMRFIRLPPAQVQRPVAWAHQTWKNIVPSALRSKVRGTLQEPRRRPDLSPSFRAELADYFREDVLRTSEMIGRDLTHWLDV